ncbi:helix-turn-helix domain-containing protein|uniref:Helix-turn-helix domain-containing protein n=1 Tax=Dendrosporobacter quercicolus TaxID=146817 RepID=A0A1G9ZWK8_9FIRM|nr:helix-turn-helix domain-containing protein [Dendrosporobacter quercicolus]NSL49626.1 helix-turn-helix domain-containing protein [Dendrosporobacter quercicolus DSM 1736]SDN25465.1 Helix-turn-helix domain-containing protein [Dendrosporobacter quercicolus]
MPRYTIKAFAEKEQVSEAIVSSWIYKHGLPVIKIGRRIYIEDGDFENWLKDHKTVITQQLVPPEARRVEMPKQCQKSGNRGILSKLRPAR